MRCTGKELMLVRGRHYVTEHVSDFFLEGGLIQEVRSPTGATDAIGGEDYWVCPGLIDIQVNGYQGHDLSGEASVADVVAVAEGLTEAGVTGFCPTVMTGPHGSMRSSLQTIAAARETSSIARDAIVGIHLEGPYISPKDGPRGAHPATHVRPPDWDEFLTFQEAAQGGIRYITLAPDLPGALPFIANAVKAGVVIGLGHHDAGGDQITAAIAAGAALSTHLGNGVHETIHRHTNPLWQQLGADGLMASLILDGYHLPPAVVKCFFRAKGADRLILVSDVIALAGLSPGQYQLRGEDVEVVEGGPARLVGTPYLAGSRLRLSVGVNNVLDYTEASFGDAIKMASVNPARILGLGRERGNLRPGARADLALFRQSKDRYELALTIVGGEIRYCDSSVGIQAAGADHDRATRA